MDPHIYARACTCPHENIYMRSNGGRTDTDTVALSPLLQIGDGYVSDSVIDLSTELPGLKPKTRKATSSKSKKGQNEEEESSSRDDRPGDYLARVVAQRTPSHSAATISPVAAAAAAAPPTLLLDDLHAMVDTATKENRKHNKQRSLSTVSPKPPTAVVAAAAATINQTQSDTENALLSPIAPRKRSCCKPCSRFCSRAVTAYAKYPLTLIIILYMWLLVVGGVFYALGVFDSRYFSVGPQPQLHFVGARIHTWLRWSLLLGVRMIAVMLEVLADDIIPPWIRTAFQGAGRRNPHYIPYTKLQCRVIIALYVFVVGVSKIFAFYLILMQADVAVMVIFTEGFTSQAFVVSRWLRGKRYMPQMRNRSDVRYESTMEAMSESSDSSITNQFSAYVERNDRVDGYLTHHG